MVYKWMKTMDIKGRVEKSSQKTRNTRLVIQRNTKKNHNLPACAKNRIASTRKKSKAHHKEHSAAKPQPKAKPFNAEERGKQRKDEESQKLTTEARRHGDTEKKLPNIQIAQQKFI